MELSTIFLYVFIGTIIFLAINLFFGDIFDNIIGLDSDIFNMTTTLSFVGLTSAFGYLLTLFSPFSTPIIFAISLAVAMVLTVVLNIFVFIPLSNMESTTSMRIESLKGELGEVTLRIPPDSIGEVMVRTPLGNVTRTAKSFNSKEIDQGEKVLIIYVEENIFHVEKYDPEFKVKL